MKRIDKVLKKLSDLYELNRRIKAYQLREERTASKSRKEDAAKERRASCEIRETLSVRLMGFEVAAGVR